MDKLWGAAGQDRLHDLFGADKGSESDALRGQADKFIKFLDDLAESDPEGYQKFIQRQMKQAANDPDIKGKVPSEDSPTFMLETINTSEPTTVAVVHVWKAATASNTGTIKSSKLFSTPVPLREGKPKTRLTGGGGNVDKFHVLACPKFLSQAAANNPAGYRAHFIEAVCQYVERKYGIKLCRKRRKLKVAVSSLSAEEQGCVADKSTMAALRGTAAEGMGAGLAAQLSSLAGGGAAAKAGGARGGGAGKKKKKPMIEELKPAGGTAAAPPAHGGPNQGLPHQQPVSRGTSSSNSTASGTTATNAGSSTSSSSASGEERGSSGGAACPATEHDRTIPVEVEVESCGSGFRSCRVTMQLPATITSMAQLDLEVLEQPPLLVLRCVADGRATEGPLLASVALPGRADMAQGSAKYSRKKQQLTVVLPVIE